MGAGGPIVLPEYETLEIAKDGVISIREKGSEAQAITEAAQIRIVNPDPQSLEKGEDGLFRERDRLPDDPLPPPDPNASIVNGFIEGSNVNPVTELTQILALNRQYEMQVKLMKTTDELSSATTQIMSAQ